MQSMLRRRHGFTLVEILIIAPFAMLLIGALIVMATQATNSSLRSYAKTRLQNDVLSALDRMSQDAQLSMHLNYTSDSDAQLKMEAIATSAFLSCTRIPWSSSPFRLVCSISQPVGILWPPSGMS